MCNSSQNKSHHGRRPQHIISFQTVELADNVLEKNKFILSVYGKSIKFKVNNNTTKNILTSKCVSRILD